MSFAGKALLGFLNLGGVGVVPILLADPLPPPPPYIPPEGYKLCNRLIAGIERKTALYICSRKDGTNKPSFFKKKGLKEAEKKKGAKKDQWSQVTSIFRTPPSSATMNFKDGSSESFRYPPFWARNSWKMEPEKHCLLSREKVSWGYDKLTCNKDGRAVLALTVDL